MSFPSSKSLSKHDRAKILHGFVFLALRIAISGLIFRVSRP